MNNKRNSSALVLPLESRQLLSATLASGVLTVNGSGAADHIGLDPRTTTSLRVEIGTNNQTFDLRQITRIVVNGLGGNDVIEVNARNPLTMGVEVHGGDGNDYLKGSDSADKLYGDAGNDFIEGKGGNDLIDGGAGYDVAEDKGTNTFTNIESRHSWLAHGVIDDKGSGGHGADDATGHT